MDDRLSRKVGQLFLIGIAGEKITAAERLHIQEYGFGGFVLFKRNCREASQIVALCRSLWGCAADLPPIIAIDQEGGRVHRLPEPFTHFPAASCMGDRDDPELAYRAGRATGTELALAGINLDFAPVLDVNTNPNCPVIGDRAFAVDPERVARLAASWARGLRDAGVIPCGKHFPGHGATDEDSHFDLPVVTKPLEALEATELAPFAHACRQQLETLMTAHVVYPALDARRPATLSPAIITGLLRHQLGYGGVVFSDDMEMHAIAQRYSAGESALRAILAGVDAVLFCHELERAVEAWECLCAEAAANAELRARVDESHGRIARLKQRYLKSFTGIDEKDIAERLCRLDHARIAAEIHASL
jgi:beta-N-acetylhexosaminidase